jgi:hypothetical protein
MDLKISIFRPKHSHGRHLDRWWNFVFTVTPLSHRWSEFIFDLGGFNTHRRFYKTMCHVFGRITFPRLKHVSLRYNDASRWIRIDHDHAPEKRSPYFHAMWSSSSIPKVNSLSLTNIFETFDIGRTLTKLELTLRPYERRMRHINGNVFDLLSESPSIEELRLNNRAALLCGVLNSRLELKMIKRLFVENTYFPGDYPWETGLGQLSRSTRALQELLQSLHMPNLAHFDCKLALHMSIADEHEQHAHLLAFDSAARVRDFVVEFDGLWRLNDAFTLKTILASFPNLQRLTIKSSVLPWSLDDGHLQGHPIHSIAFVNCLFLGREFLEDIESTARSRWAHFVGCNVIECTDYEQEQESLAIIFPSW